jgi:hypothetical protein
MTTETPSPILAALNKAISKQADDAIEGAVKAIREAACAEAAKHGLEWYWESLLRASVTTTDAKEYRAKLEAIVADKLAHAAVAKWFAPPPEPTKRTKT